VSTTQVTNIMEMEIPYSRLQTIS